MNASEKRRRSEATSKAMRRRARQTTCPKCGRGNAISRHVWLGGIVRKCRYCPHESFHE